MQRPVMEILRPYDSAIDGPFGAAEAAHLARRAGFGAASAELAQLVELGPARAVATFVDFDDVDEAVEREIEGLAPALDVDSGGPGAYDPASMERLRRWWLFRMVRTGAPLREKLVLLWHDHFATQASTIVRTRLVLAHNRLLRKYAAGSFRELVRGVARDPAMLVYLDNRLSTKEAPNENWARELVELFTLGVDRYTQDDVEAIARVFTGWTTPRQDSDEFRFDPRMHDTGDKSVFGRVIRGRAGEAGLEEGIEVLDAILAQESCAPFIAGKLLSWFACDAPEPEVVDALAAKLRAFDWSIRETLRALFGSAWFYAQERRFAHCRTPVELVVGAARLAAVSNPHLAGLESHLERLGMVLFEPPSVAGWEHGESWAGTGSVAPRLAFALALSETANSARVVTGRAAIDFAALGGETRDASELVDALAARFLQRELASHQRDAIVEFLASLGAEPSDDREARGWRRERVRSALHLVLTAPQYAHA